MWYKGGTNLMQTEWACYKMFHGKVDERHIYL